MTPEIIVSYAIDIGGIGLIVGVILMLLSGVIKTKRDIVVLLSVVFSLLILSALRIGSWGYLFVIPALICQAIDMGFVIKEMGEVEDRL